MTSPPLPPNRSLEGASPDDGAGQDIILPKAVEAALQSEDLYPTPLGLERRILDALPVRTRPAAPRSPWRAVARIAAAMLVAIGSWFAFSGDTAALASVRETPGLLARAREVVPANLLPSEIAARTAPAVAAAQNHAPAMLMLVIGVILLAGGLGLLLHWHRTTAQGDQH